MKKLVRRMAVVMLCVVLFLSGFRLYDIYHDQKDSQDIFKELTDQVAVTKDNKTTDRKKILERYHGIVERNADFIGWIRIDDTRIDYPVMQTIGRTDYYLNRNFNGEYNRHGVPYVQEGCDVFLPSDNITIYGHNMKDGTMFSDLDKYKQESFYKSHPTVHFNTLRGCNDYQVIAAFKTVVYSSNGFLYDKFHDAKTEQEFNDYVANVRSRALYDTGVSAEYGDKLITLSACEYSQKNGRIVVVAKLIK